MGLTTDYLRCRLSFLAPGFKVTRKAELVAAIEAALSGSGLQKAWDELDEVGRNAVREAVHSPDHHHSPMNFQAKYGCEAKFFQEEDENSRLSSYQTPLNSTRLNVFFYPGEERASRMIPRDLAERLRAIVPPPSAVVISHIPEPQPTNELFVRHTESEALSELRALLRLADTGGLRFGPSTGIPAKNALAKIDALLAGGDWFPPEFSHAPYPGSWSQTIGPIKSVGWIRMLSVAGLIKMNGTKSALTRKGHLALSRPAWEVIGEIWKKWTTNKNYDEFNRIDVIKGQRSRGALTARESRRYAMLAAIEECQTGEWMYFDEFSRYMRASDHLFEVSTDQWKLYIDDPNYGAMGYAGYGEWETLQDRYMLCILMEYAATLGIVDIAYTLPQRTRPVDQWGMDSYVWLSRYDGLQSFCINRLGRHVLDGNTTLFQPSQPLAQVRLSILGNRSIRVVSGSLSPAERMQIETWAAPSGDNSFQLDDSLALTAVEGGHDPDAFARFLKERDDQPLPETTLGFLEQARSNGGALRRTGAAILFECRDARTADMVSSAKELTKICLRAGETTLVVSEENIDHFRKQVHRLGLGIR